MAESYLPENLIDLDMHKLHEEWHAQPRLMDRYSGRLADAKKDHSEAKANLELVEAQLALAIKKDPGKYDLPTGARGGVTDATIEAAVVAHKKYQAAQQKMIDARHKMDLLSANVDTLQDRKKTLEDLVFLFSINYYSEPREKGEGNRQNMDELQKKADYDRMKPKNRRKREK